MIEAFTSVPVFGILPYLPDVNDREALSQAAAGLDLEAFFPLPSPQGV
jgi:hypothetical protein